MYLLDFLFCGFPPVILVNENQLDDGFGVYERIQRIQCQKLIEFSHILSLDLLTNISPGFLCFVCNLVQMKAFLS